MSFPKPDYSDLPEYQTKWFPVPIDIFVRENLSPDLAIGLTSLLFPEFYLFHDCAFRKEISEDIYNQNLSGFNGNLSAVESLQNHTHLLREESFAFLEKLNEQNHLYFATVLKHTWKAALEAQFPDRTFQFELSRESSGDYIITFWQPKHEKDNP